MHSPTKGQCLPAGEDPGRYLEGRAVETMVSCLGHRNYVAICPVTAEGLVVLKWSALCVCSYEYGPRPTTLAKLMAKKSDRTLDGTDGHRPSLRILLIDDHDAVRGALRELLDQYPDLDIIGEGTNGAVAVELAEQLHPDVILMDVCMPIVDGIEASRQIRTRHPEIRILGLSVNVVWYLEQAMLEAGASALLAKECTSDGLYEAIRSIVAS